MTNLYDAGLVVVVLTGGTAAVGGEGAHVGATVADDGRSMWNAVGATSPAGTWVVDEAMAFPR